MNTLIQCLTDVTKPRETRLLRLPWLQTEVTVSLSSDLDKDSLRSVRLLPKRVTILKVVGSAAAIKPCPILDWWIRHCEITDREGHACTI